jgi:hypothetical protein
MPSVLLVPITSAQDERQGPIFAITEENDVFANPLTGDHTDRHYTQGLKFTYLGGDDDLPGWAATVSEALPRWAIRTNAQNLDDVFSHNTYTPQNLLTNGLIKTDRPYAGWLYGGVCLQRRGQTDTYGVPVQESFEVDLGVTGRASLAGTAQSSFHGVFDRTQIPEGWNNQVRTEPGLLLKYERLWRLSLNPQTARYVDFIPHIGAELGNIQVSGNVGGTLRVGVNLPDDFGVQIIDSSASAGGGMTSATRPFAFYAFGGADGRAVGHNLFLDGSTFRSGPSVDRIPWVADLSCGVVMSLFRHLELSYTRVVRTHEFVGQHKADIFGSLEAKAMFWF